jgi:glycosyltransferase 2 family protein
VSRRTIQIAASLSITAVALWYCLHDLDLREVGEAIGDARPIWLVPLAALAGISLWLRALRWRVILETLGPIREAPVFEATCIGFMGNMVLPLRAGEIIKPWVVARTGSIGMAPALSTVAIERLLDLAMLAVFAGVTLYLIPTDPTLQAAARVLLAVVGVAIVGLAVAIRFAAPIEGLVERLCDRLPVVIGRAIREAARGFLLGVRGLARPRALALVFLYSALVWLVTVAGFSVGARALAIDAPVVALGFAVTVIVAAAVSVPSAPGYVGVFWAGSQMALALFGVPKSTALTYGLLNWMVQMVVILSLGTWSLSRLNLSLGDMAQAARSAEPAA